MIASHGFKAVEQQLKDGVGLDARHQRQHLGDCQERGQKHGFIGGENVQQRGGGHGRSCDSSRFRSEGQAGAEQTGKAAKQQKRQDVSLHGGSLLYVWLIGPHPRAWMGGGRHVVQVDEPGCERPFLFDADAAGEKAALRSIEILLKYDFDVKVMTLPKGDDPDSFIIRNGKEKFEELALKAKGFLEYQTQQFEEAGAFEDPIETTKAIRELVKTLAIVNDELKRSILLKSITKKFNLREKLIESELNNFLSQAASKPTQQNVNRTPVQNHNQQLNLTAKPEKENPFERELVRMLYSGELEIIEHIFDNISVETFKNKNLQNLVLIASEGYNVNKVSPAYLIDQISDDEARKFILKLTLEDRSISKKWDDFSFNGKIDKDNIEYAKDTVRNFLLFQKDLEIEENNKIISESKDERLHIELLKRNKELFEEKKEILSHKPGI